MKRLCPKLAACGARLRPLLGAGLLLFAAGCEPAPDAAPSYRIAVVPKMHSNEYWDVLRAGANDAVAEINRDGAKVELIWQGPSHEAEQQRQIALIEQFSGPPVNAIVLSPQDRNLMIPAVAAAMQNGVPVITFDSTLNSPDVAAYVGTDNYEAGRQAADYLAERLGGRGRILMQRYLAGSASSMEREAGFANRLREAHPGIKLLPWNTYAGALRSEALQTCREALTEYAGEADAIFVSTQFAGNEMLRALHENGQAGKVPLVIFDTNPVLVEALRDGQVDALVVQAEKEIGRRAVLLAFRRLRGEAIPQTVYTPVAIITRAQMNQPHNRDLLSPLGPEEAAPP